MFKINGGNKISSPEHAEQTYIFEEKKVSHIFPTEFFEI